MRLIAIFAIANQVESLFNCDVFFSNLLSKGLQ